MAALHQNKHRNNKLNKKNSYNDIYRCSCFALFYQTTVFEWIHGVIKLIFLQQYGETNTSILN